MKDEELHCALVALVNEIHALVRELKAEHEWRRSHEGLATKHDLERTENRIMASQAELAQQLREVLAQQKKTSGEISAVQASVDTLKQKITDLEAVIATGGEASAELTQAVADVKAQAQVVDDQIPDLPPPPPVA